MMKLGAINRLQILRDTSVGLFLGDDEDNEVLLPQKFVPDDWELMDHIEVFVFRDSENRPIATTETPKILVNQFAKLRVVHNTRVGSFVDWGLDKDLLVPFRMQHEPLLENKSYLIYMVLDKQSDRLIGTTKFGKYLSANANNLKRGDEVDLVVWEYSDLGMKVIVNHQFKGLVYHDDLFQDFEVGDHLKGWVKNVRPDGKLDISLKSIGYQHIESESDKILAILRRNGGFLALTDKSKPEEIYDQLGMSKKSFKKAIGALYKQRMVQLETDGIKLTSDN